MGKKYKRQKNLYDKHDSILKIYSNPNNLNFLQEEIDLNTTTIHTEERFSEIFPNSHSPKTPDIIAIDDNKRIAVGEIKSAGPGKRINEAREQLWGYMKEIKKIGKECTGFLILDGSYKEVYHNNTSINDMDIVCGTGC